MRATQVFQLGFAVLTFFLVGLLHGVTYAAVLPANKVAVGKKEFVDYLTHWSGEIMPLVPLRVEGEYYPGGPLYDLQGNGLDAIESQLLEDPRFNLTAFGNSTLDFTGEPFDGELQKRDRQVYLCERKPRDFDGIVPEDVKPVIDKLLRPPWQKAFCYADANSCTFLGCHGESGIFLCNHRNTDLRTLCRSACGRFSLNVYNRMMKDKRQHSLKLPTNGEPICRGWNLNSYRYIGWSWLESDMSWEVDLIPYRGNPCPLNPNAPLPG
ncbi:hypothetical protein EYR41_011235 [Orbilia oligospora]|uniref:Uncharacterized protein n=1 Tax=Orbilia oligospora TaxID=2813651 RepID=A0A7C8KPQ4_ORBOL|nr:hypothetical protein TWF751_007991 [Orbilia oligospora]TGJ63304.1 hypothetical protein EYR41_011235 [Orbilia oligospora]